MISLNEKIVQQISSIIFELLAHKEKDIYKYFKEEDYPMVESSLKILSKSRAILSKVIDGDTVYYPYRYYDDNDIHEQERLSKPLIFIRYLLNLKDNNKYVYRDKMKYIFPLPYPDSLCIQLEDQLLTIIYVPHSNITHTNLIMNITDKAENNDSNNIKRIVITDSEEDIDKIQFAGIVNIFLVNKDETVKVLK